MKGRRSAMVELFIILTLNFWFFRRKIVPRWLMACILLFGTLVINSIGDYRSSIMGKEAQGLNAVMQIDFVGNLEKLFTEGGIELENLVYNIEAYDRRMNFDYGASTWNDFVLRYIPGQFVGENIKKGMMIDFDQAAYLEFYRIGNVGGSTVTGMSDAFASFWYFGAIKFFIIAFVIAKLYRAAIKCHLVAQILIMLVYVGSLESITHGTEKFFLIFPQLGFFLLPALLYARSRSR